MLPALSRAGRLIAWTSLLPVLISAACLSSGDERAINAAFLGGGEGTTVQLCPGSVHRLQLPVRLTAPHQTLTTEGDPPGRGRALLIVDGADQATAIQADCEQCSHATIRNLEVDGNRPQLLRIKKGDALLELGNGAGQTVRNCRLYEPRGWSALHFREGDRKQCTGGTITANEIGPCGEEWDDAYDGEDELNPPFGSPNADGISLACKDSIVSNNVVYDTTDGAIVLFGSSGSEVSENAIYSRTRVVLGGINLVDYEPWAGDYTGVKVHHNAFYALGRYLKVGIVIGPASWSDDTDSVVRGAAVHDNTFQGEHFGFAITVASAEDFRVERNTVLDGTLFRGTPGARCPTAPPNGLPTAFLINRGSAKGVYQEDFINGEVQHIICIDPLPFLDQPYKPWRFRNLTTTKKEDTGAGVSAKLTDAIVKYQMTLMSRLAVLEDQIEALDTSRSSSGLSPAEAHRLIQRIQTLERGQDTIRQELDGATVTSPTDDKDTVQPLLDYLLRAVPTLSSPSTSRFFGVIAAVEAFYFGTWGSLILLTLAGIGAQTLVRRLLARSRGRLGFREKER